MGQRVARDIVRVVGTRGEDGGFSARARLVGRDALGPAAAASGAVARIGLGVGAQGAPVGKPAPSGIRPGSDAAGRGAP